MRIEIYPQNEQKILEAAGKLKISPAQVVNNILDAVNIKIEMSVHKVDIVFSSIKIDPPEKPIKPKGNFVTKS